MSRHSKPMDGTSKAPKGGVPQPDPACDSSASEAAQGIGRRAFLKFMGVGAGAAALTEALPGCTLTPGDPSEDILFSASVIRPDDLFIIHFDFINLRRSRVEDGPLINLNRARVVDGPLRAQKLIRDNPELPSYIIARLPAQHVLERAAEEERPDLRPPQAVTRRLAGKSRLVFRAPADFDGIKYSLPSLLAACSEWPLNVSLNALPRQNSRRVFPTANDVVTTSAMSSALRVRSTINQLGRGDVIRAAAVQPGGAAGTLAAAAVNGLLELPNLGPQVDLTWKPGKPKEPEDHETALEIPHRLLMSPHGNSTWSHSANLASTALGNGDTRNELWHTRLNDRVQAGGDWLTADDKLIQHKGRTLRALWSRDDDFHAKLSDYESGAVYRPVVDMEPETDPDAFPRKLWPLRARDRVELVHLTSNFALPGRAAEPAVADQLMLSALGGWLDARGDWEILGGGFNLEAWEHRATMGRDQYVKIVRSGYLFPLGHAAAHVQVSERKILPGTNGVAYLWQRSFIVIKEPVKRYFPPADTVADANGLQADQRKLPFHSIELKTLITPNLSADVLEAEIGWINIYDPKDGNKTIPFQFDAVAVDHNGNEISFNTAAIWFPDVVTSEGKQFLPARKAARDLFREANAPNTSELSGQRVAYAPSGKRDDADGAVSSSPDNTTYETQSITFDSSIEDAAPSPNFFPIIDKSTLRIESVRQLADHLTPVDVRYHDAYAKHGFSAGDNKNEGEVIFEFLNGIGLNFSNKSDRSGGFLAPNMMLSGVSRSSGPVAGELETNAQGKFDAKAFFKDSFGGAFESAKLFGTINLADILLDGALDLAPKFVTQGLDIFQSFLDTLEKLKSLTTIGSNRRLMRDGHPQQGQDEGSFSRLLDGIVLHTEGIFSGIAGLDFETITFDDLPGDPQLNEIFGHLNSLLDDYFDPILDYADRLASLTGGFRDELHTAHGVLTTIRGAEEELRNAIAMADKGLEFARNLEISLDWKPHVGSDSLGIFVPSSADALTLSATVRAKSRTIETDQGPKTLPAGAEVNCTLAAFDLNLVGELLPIVRLEFDHISFAAGTSTPAEVDVVLNNIAFQGVLGYVERLLELVDLDALKTKKGDNGGGPKSDGPESGAYLRVSKEGLSTGFTIVAPNIAIGVFSLQNISFSASLEVPFLGDSLAMRFAFCTREHPFLLSVGVFGGGGFFAITLTASGIQILEASFEFGACVAFNVAVASGSVSIMAGIYFKGTAVEGTDLVSEGLDAELTGYLRIRGQVSVLDLISASLELYMELHYEFASGKLKGYASLEIEVSVAFFSVGVKIEVEKKFAGSNGDPTFEQVMRPYFLVPQLPEDLQNPQGDLPQDPWDDYTSAFAFVA